MSAVAAIVALPVAALTIWALLRNGLGGRLVATPSGDRWHEHETPSFGGVGIFLGLLAGIGACLLAGAIEPTWELAGIAGGAAIVFAFGLIDDLRSLPPPVKLAGQFGAAGVVLASGIRVEIVENGVAATALGLLVARGDDERLQPPRQHGRPRREPRRRRRGLLRDRRRLDPRRRPPARGLARARARRGRLPPVQLPAAEARRRLHGRLGQPGDRADAGRARPRDELEGGGVDDRHAHHPAARARDPDPRHGARDRRPPRRGPARSTRAAATTRRTGSCAAASPRRAPSSC